MTDDATTPSAIDASTKPRRAAHAHWRELDDHVVILDADSSVYSTLNPVGSLIWNESDGDKTIAELTDIVVEAFEVTEDVAMDDATQFVAAMLAEGLFEV